MSVVPELEVIKDLAVWFIAIYPIVFAATGWYLANTFGSKTDSEDIDTYILKHGKLTGFRKWLVSKTLKFIHHWWIGAILAYVFNPWEPVANLPWLINEFLFWFWFGVFLEDGQFHIRKFVEAIQPVNAPVI